MKKLLLVIVLFLIGCAPMFSSSFSAGYGGKVKVNKMPKMGNGFLEYKSYSHLLEELEKEAEIKMWDSQMLKKNKSLIPLGGSIYFRYCRPSAKWSHTIIIKQDGKIIRRYSAEDVLFHSYNEYLNCFTGSILLYLDKKITDSINVFIIDEYAKERYEYTVIPEKK